MSSWRERLSDTQRNKIAPALQLWLDGRDEAELDLPSREPGIVSVWARVLEELLPEQLDGLIALGLEAEEDMLAIPGSVTREQVTAIAQHPDIIAINPVQRAELLTPPTGQRSPTF